MTRSEGEQSRPSRRLGITGYVGLVREGYDELVKAIIRPPRAEYSLNDLGPSEFRYGGVDFVRQDVSVPNRRGLALCGSLWRRADLEPGSSFPCVVYLHGNASCRAEATTIASQVLALGAALFSFDFAGCGLSEGNYISLGFFERDDVETMIGWLREYAGVGAVALWGRSMGAVSSVMQAARDPSIAGLVLDSPFASLEQVALELVSGGPDGDRPEGVPNVPGFLVKSALRMVASSVKSRAGFDLYKCRPVDAAPTCFMPALFATAHDDVLVRPHHSRLIFDAFAGDKNLVTFEGDHNEMRPGFFLDSAAIFFTNVLRIPDAAALEVPTDHSGRPLPLMQVLLMQQRGAAARLYGPRGGEATQAERARLRAEAQQELERQQLEEEEMLNRAILESLSSSEPPAACRQRASDNHAPQPPPDAPPAAPFDAAAVERAAAPPADGPPSPPAPPGEATTPEEPAEDRLLAEAIKLSLQDATQAQKVAEVD